MLLTVEALWSLALGTLTTVPIQVLVDGIKKEGHDLLGILLHTRLLSHKRAVLAERAVEGLGRERRMGVCRSFRNKLMKQLRKSRCHFPPLCPADWTD